MRKLTNMYWSESSRGTQLRPHCQCLCPQPWPARCGTVTVVVWDSWSHVCGPVLDWPSALRWWMAADCSDSLGTRLVCCPPHNGLTHRELTPSLFSVHLWAVSQGISVWLLCCFWVLMETEVFSFYCVSFCIVPPFHTSVEWWPILPLHPAPLSHSVALEGMWTVSQSLVVSFNLIWCSFTRGVNACIHITPLPPTLPFNL